MSRGQKPRWPAYFPNMKQRGRYRNRRARIVVWTSDWKPVWPPVLHVDGETIRVDRGTFRVDGRVLNRDTGWWEQG